MLSLVLTITMIILEIHKFQALYETYSGSSKCNIQTTHYIISRCIKGKKVTEIGYASVSSKRREFIQRLVRYGGLDTLTETDK